MSSPGERTVGVAAGAGAAILFGSAYVATAFQLHGFTPLGGALWRSGLAAVALAILGVATRRASPRGAGVRGGSDTFEGALAAGRLVRLAVLGAAGGLCFIVGMNLAVAWVGATVTAFVAGLYSIVAALFAPLLLDERLEPRAVAGFAVALVGTALLAELAPGTDTLRGLAAGGGAAVGFGLYLVLIRRWSRAIHAGPIAVGLANTTISAVGLAIVLGISDPAGLGPRATPPDVVVATAWLVVASAAGQLLVTAALRRVEAGLVSSLLLLNPITATVLSALLLSEVPTAPRLLGGLLVLAGMAASSDLVGVLRRRRAQESAPEAVR
ncbi:MAG TPA: DMT family transporter [Candidatus Dormibacteraeota bacterium]|nr:DMT family transporter [Candidatus Dormibacteraeota bacterium]